MNPSPENWRSLEELYEAALNLPAGERAAFLNASCPDEKVRCEVESLLVFAPQGDPLLKHSPWAQSETIGEGTELGPYRVGQRIGAGGMGEVYKARDNRLEREVALKILPAYMMGDVERKARFIREARAASRLNHPNVVTVYEIGEQNGRVFIAMEYVDGKGLDFVIPATGLPIADVLKYAIPIAAALAKAHASGIVHRDLKPGNVMIAKDGSVKVLDFGLAKLLEEPANQDTSAQQLKTQTGVFMGTPAFMSPEQAEGKPVDPRSDIFSFGAVLYQMTTGKRAFEGNSMTAVLAAVLHKEPEPLDEKVPADLQKIVLRCLMKDPERRFQSMADVRVCLEEVRQEPMERGHPAAGPPARSLIRRLSSRNAVFLAIVSAAALGVAAGHWLANRNADLPEWIGNKLGGPGIAMRPTISPDGKLLAFSAMVDGQTQLAVMQPDSGSWTVLTHDRNVGTQAQMSWAPDGSQIYFDRVWGRPRGVYSISPLGGEPRLVLDGAQCPHALPDGSLIVVEIDQSARYRLYRLWPDSGKVQVLPALLGGGEAQVVDPLVQVFPDGLEVVYLGTPDSQTDGVPRWYILNLATLRSRRLNSQIVGRVFGVGVSSDNRSALLANSAGDEWKIVAIPRSEAGAPRTLISFPKPDNIYGIDAAPDGSLYFDYMMRPTSLLQFDNGAKAVSETVAAIDGPGLVPLEAGSFLFDRLEGGKRHLKVFRDGIGSRNLLESAEESSTPAARVGPGSVAFLAGPEDVRRLAIATLREGRIVRRFAFDAASVNSIAATPDSDWLYYCDHGQVWRVNLQENGEPEPALVSAGDSVAIDGSGKYLYIKRNEKGRRDLVRMPLIGGQAEVLAIPAEYTISDDRLSPAAVDAAGRILFEVDSADSWYERVAVIDTARKRFAVLPIRFDGDLWMPGWESDGRVAAIGARIDSTLWRYRVSPARKSISTPDR